MATGRRAGVSTAKEDILEAARALFADVGFDRATIRAIASKAGVDVALVSYYYGNKKDLYKAVMNLPIDPEHVIGSALDGPRAGVGERLLRAALTIWEDDAMSVAFKAVLRQAIDLDPNTKAPSVFGEFIASGMVPILRQRAGVTTQTARLVVSTMFGLAFMRYLVRSPLFTEPTAEELIAAYAPAVQRIVDADGT